MRVRTDELHRVRDGAPPIGRDAMPFSQRSAWLVVTATALVSMSVGVGIGALGPSLPQLQVRLHTPLSSLGILFSASFAGSLLATLCLGPVLDRRAPRGLLLAGVAIMATGMCLLTLTTSLWAAVAALAFAGLGGGTNSIGSAVLTTRMFGRGGGRALSLINMSFGLGACAGPLAAAWALETLHQSQPVFLGVAALLTAPFALYAMLPLPSPATQRPQDPAPALGPVRRRLTILSVLAFLYLGTEIGFAGWAFTYVRQTSGAGVTLASWAPALFWLALSLSSLGAALRPRRLPAEWLVLACGAGALAMTLVLLAARGVPAIEILAAASVGLALGPVYPLTLAEAASLLPASAGRISALVIASSQFGGSVLPWVQGLLLGFGSGWGVGLTLVSCAGMIVLQLGLMSTRTAPATAR